MSLELFVLWRICQEVVADPVGESKARQSPSAALPESCGSVSQEQHRMSPQPPKEDTGPALFQMGSKLKTTQRQQISFELKNKLLY